MYRNVSGIWAATDRMFDGMKKNESFRSKAAGDFKSVFEEALEKERENDGETKGSVGGLQETAHRCI